MLDFYYHPLSPLARRVWITLLEKEIPFTEIVINLNDGEQFKPSFLKINPFHHIPVVVDDGLRVLESLAILDYLECKYPEHSLLPDDASQIAKVRMAQMVANNELSSLVVPLIAETENSPKLQKTKRKIRRILDFFEELLGDENYFGGNSLSLADIVAGNNVMLINKLGFNVDRHPKIQAWCDRLMKREAWQTTQPNREQVEVFRQTVQQLIKLQGQSQIVYQIKHS